MKYVDEYRTEPEARRCAEAIARSATRAWTLMEICGGQTHAILRFGLEQLLPARIELIHGPGCPVCVTPVAIVDAAIALAARPEVTLCSFGDMLRVPGSERDLLATKAAGGDVRIVYSPLDALEIARRERLRQVVFFAVGFETTAPATALAVARARAEKLRNFSLLAAHVRVPPALEALLRAPGHRIQGVLAAGHVCTVMGLAEYAPICARHRVPIVVTGFEPLDLLQGVLCAVRQLEAGRAEVENAYARVVRDEGNRAARSLVEEMFEPVDREWRGLGTIAHSGLALREDYAELDAARRFPTPQLASERETPCISGRILRGEARPPECPAFGSACRPEHPLGAPMVSSEGACAAYHRYRRPALQESRA
jgi:hydrogenase expression/formation protein HypD